ncbi:thiolase [Sphingobium sp. TA15]|uniref:Acetyl-CoA acyltransferase n=1 Tax=Sphingobium indicum (strain DSM 16413 / CCM 7287 / MTCC 6362 / UT26 / NBRC 101211 / UT26S) TaxID=452662 RepID=D4Z0U8_SPHIU|nr:thiolase family protein [Sphingobium indicum]BAI96230.1 acetyl-CoA acyltransferase [Sphingobium indicum UT26S]BDD65530.1 thiolase [Sphingobium sp. TA15]
MDDIYIIGVAMTRFGKHLDRSLKSLVAEAVSGALSDAGAQISDVDAAIFANSTQGIMENQHAVRGQMVLRPMGFAEIPILNVENACAGGSTALHQAVAMVRGGMAEVALAVGAEKMHGPDKLKSSAIFEGAWDVHEASAIVDRLSSIGEGVEPPEGTAPGVKSPFMELYASFTRGHMRTFGTTQEQIAAVASKNHHHSTMNPLAQFQTDFSIAEVLAAPVISWPLTLPMCSPISDGAAAALICSKSVLSRFADAHPIRLLATALTSGSDREWKDFGGHLCRKAAEKAYAQAGIGPSDVSVAEVHDASAFAEIVQLENLGLCEAGQGGWMSARGETRIGGRVPVNPSGGLESKGHPISASGLGQIYELVTQLRGRAGARQVDGARIAVAENGGGFHGVEEAAAVVTILGA